MEHVAAVPSTSSGRMSPEALALAVAVHGVAALALWWMALHRPPIVPLPDPVDIMIERPKPAEPPPPPPPPQPAEKQPEPKPVPDGIAPPAEITADKRTQKPPSGDADKDVGGQPPQSLEQEVPAPPPDPPPPQIAAARPEPVQPPPPEPPKPEAQPQPQPPPAQPQPPAAEHGTVPPAPPVEAFRQPLPSVQPAPTISPPPPPRPAVQQPPAPTPPRPVPPAVAHAPPAVSPNPGTRPTPHVMRPQMQPPSTARRDEPTSSSPFVNPADSYNRALAGDNYLWQIVRKLSGYTFWASSGAAETNLTVRIVLTRDGRLVSADIVRSSGFPEIDRGVLTGVRAGSPYTPLPPSIGGDRATFNLPLYTTVIQ